ncbi:MAG: SIR2 family protein [Vicinamibacterales bacterium]
MLSELQSTQAPLVAFVGAGASAIPPSSLPGWLEFNQVLLECLCERIDDYSRHRQPTAKMLAAFKALRDDRQLLTPDFQAQLMEEEIGADYFGVWQSIDTDQTGPVHTALAELAARSRLVAIVTTNFDRLLETALAARGVPFEVFCDAAGFDRLLARDGDAPTPLPVIKIHGSIDDVSSLVDTLRQRVAGRPASLNAVLRRLLQRAPWVFLGWSGADLGYDEHYLGLRDAAADARGFVFVTQPGRAPRPGVAALIDAYRAVDDAKAEAVEGDLATWLSTICALPEWTPPPSLRSPAEVRDQVRARIRTWTDTLGPIAAVNIICAMMTSSGLERHAWWLMRKVFKSYRTSDDTKTRSYQRYNYNYGMALLESGFIRNPVRLADDKSNMIEWRTAADQNAFEFLGRGYREGGLLVAGGALAQLLAYRGEVGRAIALADAVITEATKREAWLELCDIAIASTTIYDIVQFFGPPSQHLESCRDKARELGDEPRRAMLSAHLARLYTNLGDVAKAGALLDEAEQVADRLGLEKVREIARATRGFWMLASGQPPQTALDYLQRLVDDVQAEDAVPLVTKIDLADPDADPTLLTAHRPFMCRVLLDLAAAALHAGDGPRLVKTFDDFAALAADRFDGYFPHYAFLRAQCLMHYDPPAREPALASIADARAAGAESGNPWVAQFADRLEAAIRSEMH